MRNFVCSAAAFKWQPLLSLSYTCGRCVTIASNSKSNELEINEQIRDKEIRLIGADGAQMGIMSPRDALKMAIDKDLDLVKVAPQAKPPVCKILDYGKYRFEMQKKEKEAKEKHAMLDERLLATPAVAIEVCHGVTMEMAELSKTTMELAINMLFQYDKATEEQIEENENRIDKYEDKLNAYLVRISKHSLSSKDSRTVSKMLHCIGNFERIGDHAVNIMESAHELQEKGLHFSGDAAKELRTLCDALLETLNMAYQAFEKDDLAIAHQVEPLEEVIDTLNLELKNRHIKRLQNEECTVELGYIYQDLLTNIERISDHCSNIAGVLIEIDEQQNIHKYLFKLKENDETFQESYHQYLNHYYLELGQPTLDEVVDA